MDLSTLEKSKLVKVLVVLGVLLSVYFIAKIIGEVKGYRFIGGGATAYSTISFEGKGEVSASPDMATISFTIREESKEVKDAQTKVATKESAVLEFLEKSGVEKKNIKTESYNTYPKYDYGVPCYSGMVRPCREGTPKIIGYEVSEYVTVKVLDLEKVGEVVSGIGSLNVSEISGPNFSVQKEEELKAEARKMAIDDAKAKAKVLSKDLGVRLVRVINFSENGSYPMMYGKAMMYDMPESSRVVTPTLPSGENKIISNIVITYEIR